MAKYPYLLFFVLYQPPYRTQCAGHRVTHIRRFFFVSSFLHSTYVDHGNTHIRREHKGQACLYIHQLVMPWAGSLYLNYYNFDRSKESLFYFSIILAFSLIRLWRHTIFSVSCLPSRPEGRAQWQHDRKSLQIVQLLVVGFVAPWSSSVRRHLCAPRALGGATRGMTVGLTRRGTTCLSTVTGGRTGRPNFGRGSRRQRRGGSRSVAWATSWRTRGAAQQCLTFCGPHMSGELRRRWRKIGTAMKRRSSRRWRRQE